MPDGAAVCALRYARTAGLLYFFIIVAGGLGEFYRDQLVVSGDAAATAGNILAHEPLFRVAIAGELLSYVCDVAVAVLLYLLLKPVSESLALFAGLLRVVTDIATGMNKLFLFATLFFLGDAPYLKTFSLSQRQTVAYLSLKLHDYGFAISLVFFAFGLLALGYLVFRSDYFPKLLGVALMLACPSYLINSFALLLTPQYASATFLVLLIPFVAESALCLWLIVKGVDVPKWEARAGRN